MSNVQQPSVFGALAQLATTTASAATNGSTPNVLHIREKTSTSNLSLSLRIEISDKTLYITSASSKLFLTSSTGISTEDLYSLTNLSWKVTYKSGTLISRAFSETVMSFLLINLSYSFQDF